MNHVLCERNYHHGRESAELEHRVLPAAAARAIRDAAEVIVITMDDIDSSRSATGTDTPPAVTLTDPAFTDLVSAHADALPAAVRTAVRAPATASGAAIVTGLPVHDAELGPTPRDWAQAAACSTDPRQRAASFTLDVMMLLLARCAGEPFGWQGQQGGRLVNNIVPSRGHEHEQSGASSATLLCPHSEDAFHPRRAHLLLLGCLRNPGRVGTTVASVREARLGADHRRLLSRPTLPILPDVSYGTDFHRYPAAPIATLGDIDGRPTLRYDPAYTPLDDADDEFRSAYAELGTELERVCRTAVLAPGELLLVDNDVVVHGRVPFTPRYDGTDRWLKRVNIRLPRRRDPAEADESGYGQHTVTPFAEKVPAAQDVPHQ